MTAPVIYAHVGNSLDKSTTIIGIAHKRLKMLPRDAFWAKNVSEYICTKGSVRTLLQRLTALTT